MITIWIEPDWNVKVPVVLNIVIGYLIWIEPDWNVKIIAYNPVAFFNKIWIEPDWNVKTMDMTGKNISPVYLNRTRLECKVNEIRWTYRTDNDLNRTRLECKVKIKS